MSFRLVPKSSTLDDLERPIRTIYGSKNAPFRARHKNMNEETQVSRNMSYMLIFSGVLRAGASNDSGVVDDGNFRRF